MKGLKSKLKRPSTTAVASALGGNGTKENVWNRHDQRVWQSVANNQPAKVAAKLTKHPDVNVNKIYPNVGYSVVHYAAAKGLDDCLNILLAHRADASASDITGATPLHAASRYGHRGTTAKLLASRLVNINQCDKNKCSALHFAAFEGHVECVKLITEQLEADLHCTDKDGRTPLMVAAAMGQLEVCRILLERNSNVHHRDNGLGHTALTLASESGHPDVVRLLCEYGAQHSVALSNGQTALDLAKKKNRKSVIDAIHVAQLTEAANKTNDGPRLSVSSNKYKMEETSEKTKRRSVDSLLDKSQATYIDDLVAGTHLSGSRTPKARRAKEDKKSKSNIARVKAAVEAKMKNNSSDKNSRRGSNASGLSAVSTPQQKIKGSARISPDSNTLSLYTAGNGTHFYDKEIKFYDTSLSNSSLDVSSTCSAAMNNISKSMDSLKPTPEEDDSAFENPHNDSYLRNNQMEETDFSRRANAIEYQKLQKSNVSYEAKIRELETELRRVNDVAAKEALNRNNEELAFAKLNAEKEEYEKTNKSLLQKIEQMKEESVSHNERMKCLESELKSANQQILAIEELNEANSKQKENCERLSAENVTLKETVKKIEYENKEMREKIHIESENKSMIINHAKKKINEAEQICAQEEQKGREAERNYESAKNEIDHMKKINEELLKKVEIVSETSAADKQIFDANTLDMLQILKMIEEENKSETSQVFKVSHLRDQIELLIKTLKDGEEQIANAEASKKTLEEKQMKLTTSLDEQSKEVTELRKRMKETEKELEQKTQESNRLENELGNAKLKLQTVKLEKNSANDGLVTELVHVRAELAKYEAEKMSNSEKTVRMAGEIEKLKRLLDEATDTVERQRNTLIPRQIYEDDCEKLKEMMATVEKNMAETAARHSQAQLEIANKEQEIADLRVERNQSEARASKLQSEIEDVKSKCHESDVQVNMLRQQLTEIKHKYEKSTEEIANLRKSRRDLTLRLTTKQGEMSENERKKVDNLRRQLEHLCKHLQESERRYKETISVYRGHLLSAVEGQLDSDVLAALQEIIKLRKKEERGQGSHI